MREKSVIGLVSQEAEAKRRSSTALFLMLGGLKRDNDLLFKFLIALLIVLIFLIFRLESAIGDIAHLELQLNTVCSKRANLI